MQEYKCSRWFTLEESHSFHSSSLTWMRQGGKNSVVSQQTKRHNHNSFLRAVHPPRESLSTKQRQCKRRVGVQLAVWRVYLDFAPRDRLVRARASVGAVELLRRTSLQVRER